MIRAASRAPGAWLYRASVARIALNKVGVHELVRRLGGAGQVVLLDNEGVLQAAHNLFAHTERTADPPVMAEFARTDDKTDDQSYFFKGFPSVWNFLVIYMMLLGLNPWINLAAVVICNILIFVPVKYLYPTRNNRLRKFTLGFTYLYGAIGVWGLLQYPNVPDWVAPASFVYVAYYAALSFFPKLGTA